MDNVPGFADFLVVYHPGDSKRFHFLQKLNNLSTLCLQNLQGECRRLRSQVSDLEQRNVALNLLLTQSLRDSMIEQKSKDNSNGVDDFSIQVEGLVQKSASYDCNMETEASGGSCARDSFCSAVSDSELRAYGSIFSDPAARPLVSKDANWMLSAQGHGLSGMSAQSSPLSGKNPVERAEKLLAVLKHRLFSAQLNSYRHPAEKRRSKKRHEEVRHSLPPVHQHWEESGSDGKESATGTSSLPARPNTLSFLPSKAADNEQEESSENDPSSAVRALVQVLEKRVVSLPSPVADLPAKSPRPPVAPAPGLRAIRTTDTESPASKDEGYSTMSSDVQVDSSSSSSSFIASGCSSPATLRRGGANGTLHTTTRSLPMAKRKPIASADPHRQPNRSISLQETHSGAGLEEVKEEENSDASSSSHQLTFPPQNATVMSVMTVATPALSIGENKKHQLLTRPLKRGERSSRQIFIQLFLKSNENTIKRLKRLKRLKQIADRVVVSGFRRMAWRPAGHPVRGLVTQFGRFRRQ